MAFLKAIPILKHPLLCSQFIQWTVFHKGSILNPDMEGIKYVMHIRVYAEGCLTGWGEKLILKSGVTDSHPDFFPVLNCDFSEFNHQLAFSFKSLCCRLESVSPICMSTQQWEREERCWAETSWSCLLHVAAHHQ